MLLTQELGIARAIINQELRVYPPIPPAHELEAHGDEDGFGSQMGRAAERASNAGVPTQREVCERKYSATSYTFTLPLGICVLRRAITVINLHDVAGDFSSTGHVD